jgi:hypothetical protein
MTKGRAMAKQQKAAPRKIVGDDGPIKPRDPANVAQDPNPPIGEAEGFDAISYDNDFLIVAS